ncbi:platelet glycoprotein IX [Thalassophryne amazonica]|uniref:platelet glycoprotein IX n=1 Tax=Thalassophryne amazonica TaxID=390379 RepID=UPI0014715A2C|nr:platelet glycoprotein IX [Thalassophryne amazonica]
MSSCLDLTICLILATSTVHTEVQPCFCSALLPAGLKVNCSSLNLMKFPHLLSDTTELHLQDNQLPTVPPGRFDELVRLKKLSLSGNPFHCDCRIQYLRKWLQKNRALVSTQPTCAAPRSVAHRGIADLADEYFSSCIQRHCAGGTYSFVMGVMLCCLIVLLMYSLRLAQKSTFILHVKDRHAGLPADGMRPPRPKQRRRREGSIAEVSENSEFLQRPLVDTELLPQILEVLRVKYNIKLKAT